MIKSSKNKRSSNRAKPLSPKAGVTMNGKRRYSCGGKLIKKK